MYLTRKEHSASLLLCSYLLVHNPLKTCHCIVGEMAKIIGVSIYLLFFAFT